MKYSNRKQYTILVTVCITVVLLLSTHAIKHIIKNHPHEYVYFNELSGGIENAYGNYEMDYYYHSIRAASEWVIENAERKENEKLIVASWHPSSVNYFFREDTADFRVIFNRWYERGNTDWDYAIYTISGMMPEEIKNEKFPPVNAVHTIKVDDTPIAFILKRETKDDLLASQMKNAKQYPAAITSARKALTVDPTNVSIYMNLIESYYYTRQLDSAKYYLDIMQDYVPKYEPINYFLAHYYLSKNQKENAINTAHQILNDNFKFASAYHLLFQIYAQSNDLKSAEKVMLRMLDAEQLDSQGFNQLVSVYKAQGMDDRTAYKRIYNRYVKHYEEIGDEKKAEPYREALSKL